MEKDEEQSDEKYLQKKYEEESFGYPVDHGWAWMVMLGAFGMNIFNVGGLKSFGVLFQDLQKKFSASSSEIAGVYSLSSFMLFAMGPLANALANHFSYRCVVIFGGILIGLGFFLTSFVHSLWLLFISYGVITGIGFGLSYSPFIVMVGHHFDKRRSLAMGISVSGSGFGSFIFPNLLRFMLKTYNIDEVMLILAGTMANVCVCGCLLRPIEYYRSRKKLLNKPERLTQQITDTLISQTDNSDISTEKDLLKKNELRSKPKHRMNTLMHADSITSGSLVDIVFKQEEEFSNDDKHLETDKTSCSWIKRLFNCMKTSEDGCKANKTKALLDCSLISDPMFLIYAFALLFSSFGYINIFLIIPTHAEDLGMTNSDGAFLISLMGLSDIFGRLFFGWFADLKLFSSQYQFFLSLFFCGISITLIPFISSYSGLAAICWFTGLFAGAYIALVPTVLVDVLGLEKLSSSLGLSLLFISFGMLLGPPAIGWIRDISNRRWTNSLYFCGSFNFLASSMALLKPLVKRYKERKHKEQNEDDNNAADHLS